MTIAALITEGIGPGGSIKYVMTGGLDISSIVPSIWTDNAAASTTWTGNVANTNIWTDNTNPASTWTSN